MANNQIKVSLMFGADTSQAKRSLQDLSKQMNDLLKSQTTSSFGEGLTKDIQVAREEAIKLQTALNNSVNVDTGKFDLSKFTKSLKLANTDLTQVRNNLIKLGPQGEQAFLSLTKSIVQAEIPARKMNHHLEKMAESIKSTARWKISSSIINSFSGAIQQAYIYAQDLNKSLNDIRIVTGYNTERMERFAKVANSSAKALSTTTNEYAKASLIYFQQGLSDADVKARADTTIKLANVTGRSAEEVSSYMTAVWNNFDNGTKSLEYYADAIAALGAATASNSEEIATGLQKFAAVANTVGLSYEYATAALATVTAQTRESAETVGTAFKTIFARLESLSLGETLEDNTSMTKYSQALATVGVQIKDANGTLKDMDTIIDELGQKWGLISKDQQVALAQTVAGMRQYNNFIALMDNYSTFSGNVEIATNSEGALQEQADIYAESWEAARNRVRAAAESIYEKLLDDDFFINLLNTVEKLITGFDKFLDRIGGLEGLLTSLGAILTTMFQKQIVGGLHNAVGGIKDFFGVTRKQTIEFKKEALSAFETMTPSSGYYDEGLQAKYKITQDQLELQLELADNEKNLTDFQKAEIQVRMEKLRIMGEEYQASADAVEQAKKELVIYKESLKAAEEEKLAKAKESQDKLTGAYDKEVAISERLGKLDEIVSSKDFDPKTALSEVQNMMVEIDENFDASAEEWAAIMMKHLASVAKDIETIIEEAGDEGSAAVDEVRSRLSGAAQAAGDKMQGARARQFAKSAGVEYKDAVQVIKDVDWEKNARVPAYGGVGSDEIESKQNTYKNLLSERANVTDSSAEKNAEERVEAIDAYEKDLKTTNETASKAEEIVAKFYQNLESKNKSLEESLTEFDSQIDELKKGVGEGEQDIIEALTQLAASIKAEAQGPEMKDKKTGRATKKAKKELAKKVKESQEDDKDTSIAKARQKSRDKKQKKAKEGADKKVALTDEDIKKVEVVGEATDKTTKKQQGYNNTLDQTRQKIKPIGSDWATVSMSVMSSVMSMVSAMQMLGSLFDTLSDPDMSGWEKFTTALTTIFSVVMMLIPAIAALNKIQMSNGASLIQNAGAAMLNAFASKKLAKAKEGETAKVLASNLAWHANPVIWIAAVILAVIAVVVALTAAIGNNNKALAAAREAQINQVKQNLEMIESNEKLSDSISALTDEYKELKTSGKDSYETFKKLKDQIPELIQSYEELAGTMDIGFDSLAKLNQGYELFKQTGDISMFEEAQKRMDLSVANKKREQAQFGWQSATEQFYAKAREGIGKKIDYYPGKNYTLDLHEKMKFWGASSNSSAVKDAKVKNTKLAEILKQEMGDQFDLENQTIRVNLSDPKEALKYYENLSNAVAKAREKLSAKELAETKYDKLVEELDSLKEIYGDLSEFQTKLYDIAKEAFAAGEGETYLNEVFDGNIKSLEEYESELNKLYKSIRAKYGDLTDEQVSALLLSSPEFAAMETGRLLFDSEKGTVAEQLKINSDLNKEQAREVLGELKTWWDGLPEEDRVLVSSIDFSNIDSTKEAQEKLTELQEQAKKFNIRSEAETLGIDITTLEIYSDILSETNKGLEKNNSLTDQVALNYLKINKAVESLNKTFEDNLEILKEGNRLSPQYAAAVASVQKAVEEAFGVEFGDDSTFVEENWELMLQFTKGNFDNFAEFQDKMAAERIKAMDPNSFKASSGYGGDVVDNAQEYLAYAINKLAVPAEKLSVGEEVSIDKEALDTFNLMLKAGQITKDDLEKIYAEMGFEAEWENGELTGWLTRTMDITTAKQAFGLSDTDIKNRKKELDNLREEQRRLTLLGKTYDKISILKDNAYGPKKLEYMAQEKAILEEELVVMDRQLATLQGNEQRAKNELATFMAQLQKDYEGFNIELQFDELTGELLNVEEILNLGASEIVSDADYEKLIELIEGWETYADSVDDAETELLELQAQLDNLFTEYLNQALEFNIEFRSKGLEHLERVFSRLEDKSFTIADAFANLTSQATIQMANYKDYEDSIRELAKKKQGSAYDENASVADIYSDLLARDDLTEAEASSLYQWYDGIVDTAESLEDINAQIHEQIIKYFEDIVAEYDKIASKAEEINSAISDYQNIADIVGEGFLGIDAKAFTKEMQKASGLVATEQMIAARATKEALEEGRKEVEAKLAVKGLSDEDREALERDLEEIDAMIVESGQNMRQHWTDALQAAADAFATEMEIIAEEFEESISGSFGTLERMSEAFEQKSTLNKQYLSDYKKIYELSKLTRQIESRVNNTSSVRAKQMLASLQKEINDMEASGVKMSEYDLQYLQKRYDLKVAEIALEEQQKNKSTVRLTQMADGSWGYVYTKNMDDAEKAMQSYEDALYNAQSTTDDYLNTLGSSIIKTQQEAADAIAAVWADATLTMEEKQKRADELTAYYTAQLEYYTSEYDKAVGNNYRLYNSDWQNFSEMTGKKLGDLSSFNTAFNDTVLGSMQKGVDSAKDIYDTFSTQLGSVESGDGFIGELYSKTQIYSSKLDEIMKLANTTLDTYAGMASKEILGEDGTGTKSGMVYSLTKLGSEADVIGGKISALHGSLNDSTPVGDATLVALTKALTDWFGSETAEGSFAQEVEEVKGKANEIGDFFMEAATIPEEGLPYLTSITKAIENWRKTALQDAVNAINSTMEGIKTPYDNAMEKIKDPGDTKFMYSYTMGDYLKAGSDEFGTMDPATFAKSMYYRYMNGPDALSSADWEALGLSAADMGQYGAEIHRAVINGDTATLTTIGQSMIDQGINRVVANAYGATTGSEQQYQKTASDLEAKVRGTISNPAHAYSTYAQLDEVFSTIQSTAAKFDGSDESRSLWIKRYGLDATTYHNIRKDPKNINYDTIKLLYKLITGEEYSFNSGAGNGGNDAGGGNVTPQIVEATAPPPPPPSTPPLTEDSQIDLDPPYETGDYVTGTNLTPYEHVKGDYGSADMEHYMLMPDVDLPLEGARIEDRKKAPEGFYYDVGKKVFGINNSLMPGNFKVWFHESQLKPKLNSSSFDTGGYTGAWGTDGRLAMLHQKELVLNASDTENMLAAVDILREVVRQIDLQAANSALVANLKAPYTGTSQEVLQQEVNIHAEFPNATNHSEIEEAFKSLINQASQYVNRNRY